MAGENDNTTSAAVHKRIPSGGRTVYKGENARLSEEVVTDQNGLRASDYFKTGSESVVDPSIREAVRKDRAERGYVGPKVGEKTLTTPLGQPLALFKHREFTQEEDEAICTALLAGIPLYLIADKLHTSRGNLSRHVKESKVLSEAWNDREESILDHVEFQAKRLVDSGNPAMIMYWLEHKGKSRGWGQQDLVDTSADDSRIVIGEISADDIAEAKQKVNEANRATNAESEIGLRLGGPDGMTGELGTLEGGKVPRPSGTEFIQTVQKATEMAEDRAKTEAERAKKIERFRKDSVDVDEVRVSGSDGSSPSLSGAETVVAEPVPIAPDVGNPVRGGFGSDGWFGGYGGDDTFGGVGGGGGERAPWDEGGGYEPYGF